MSSGRSYVYKMSVNKKEPTWAEYMRTVGINIQRERIKHDMSQERLAYSAGLSRFMYQQLEKGESRPHTPANPSLKSIMAIAQVLDMPLDSLLPTGWPDLRAK